MVIGYRNGDAGEDDGASDVVDKSLSRRSSRIVTGTMTANVGSVIASEVTV